MVDGYTNYFGFHPDEKYKDCVWSADITASRTRIINKAIKKFNLYSYLEIGVGDSENFWKVKAKHKDGVDPNGFVGYTMTSDEFFEVNTKKYDFIFLDGLHLSEQIYKDVINSLDCLREGGIIMCHDMNPQREEHQVRECDWSKCSTWNGDVWKTWIRLRRERYDLEMYVINTDCGCGIIKKGNQTLLKDDSEINFNNLDANRVEWLNLKEVEEIEWLGVPYHGYMGCDVCNGDE